MTSVVQSRLRPSKAIGLANPSAERVFGRPNILRRHRHKEPQRKELRDHRGHIEVLLLRSSRASVGTTQADPVMSRAYFQVRLSRVALSFP